VLQVFLTNSKDLEPKALKLIMKNNTRITIESLGAHDSLCVLRGRRGNSIGTGSREVLEILQFIVEQCDEANFYYGRRWELNIPTQPASTHIRRQYA